MSHDRPVCGSRTCPHSDPDQVTAAYRAKARHMHPDVGDPGTFLAMKVAAETALEYASGTSRTRTCPPRTTRCT